MIEKAKDPRTLSASIITSEHHYQVLFHSYPNCWLMQIQRYVEDVSAAINYIQILSVVNPSAVQSDKPKQLQEWLSLYPKVKQDVQQKKEVDAKKAEEAQVQITLFVQCLTLFKKAAVENWITKYSGGEIVCGSTTWSYKDATLKSSSVYFHFKFSKK
jgi:hypothetical protein